MRGSVLCRLLEVQVLYTGKVVLVGSISKRMEYDASLPSPSPLRPVVSLWWDSTEVGGDHDDILTFATAEDEWRCITLSRAERRSAAVQGVVHSERY